MAYIKWSKIKYPYVFESYTNDDGFQRDVYLGSYRKYRDNRPYGDFTMLVKTETLFKWMAEHPERINLLSKIDKEMQKKHGC